jgi:outer membrane protein, heavy metal efflux system
VALAGCAHYSPRPRAPERVAADFASRTLDDPGLRRALEKALPARSWPRQQWDRADLLFAMLYFNDSIAEGRAAVAVTTAARRTARQLPNPTVGLAGEYANQHDGSPLWLWGVATDWLLDFGLRRGARIAVADLTEQQARYDFAEVTWKARDSLRRALVELLLTERELALLEGMQSDRQNQLLMARPARLLAARSIESSAMRCWISRSSMTRGDGLARPVAPSPQRSVCRSARSTG